MISVFIQFPLFSSNTYSHLHNLASIHLDYGKINALYAYFLRGKITFHYKHPLVLGTLSLDDYQKKIKNQPEVALYIRFIFLSFFIFMFFNTFSNTLLLTKNSQQMICHLLDLQDMVLDLEEGILSFHGRDLHETKVPFSFIFHILLFYGLFTLPSPPQFIESWIGPTCC